MGGSSLFKAPSHPQYLQSSLVSTMDEEPWRRLLADNPHKLAANPRLLSPPSNVGDPDGILSAVARLAVDKILQQCPYEIGIALFNTLHLPASEDGASNAIFEIARAIFDAWGIGRKGHDDGML